MSDLKKRVSNLESKAGPELPILALTQSLDDPDIYSNDIKGITCRRDDFEELGKQYTLIIVQWAEA